MTISVAQTWDGARSPIGIYIDVLSESEVREGQAEAERSIERYPVVVMPIRLRREHGDWRVAWYYLPGGQSAP